MFTYKTLILDKLKDNATIKTLFSANATGSCRVIMENLIVSASYPQILIGYGGNDTIPNMDADAGRIYLTVECKGTGSTHAYQEIGKFRSAILAVIDDTSLQSNTAVCYHIRKTNELEGFNEEEKFYWLRLGFNSTFRQNANFA